MIKGVSYHDVVAGVAAIILTAGIVYLAIVGRSVPAEIGTAWGVVVSWLFRGAVNGKAIGPAG